MLSTLPKEILLQIFISLSLFWPISQINEVTMLTRSFLDRFTSRLSYRLKSMQNTWNISHTPGPIEAFTEACTILN